MSHDEVIARLRRLDTCALSDALDQLGLLGSVSGLAPRTVRTRICGRVITVKLAAGAATGGAPHLGARAIEAASPGDVIVVEQRSGIDAAGWGGILSNAARFRGLAGVVVEGPARDVDEAADIGFPLFSRAVTARTARGRLYEVATGVPIQVGDTTVSLGDYVAIDTSGAVFVAEANVQSVLAAAESIAAREANMTKEVLGGASVSSIMGAQYEKMLER